MFGLTREKKEPLPSFWAEGELEKLAVNYDTVVNYLLGLSDKEYKIVIDVTDIHRKANQDAAKVRGVAVEPTTFINDPADELQTIEPVFIDKTDKPNNIKSRKVKVND